MCELQRIVGFNHSVKGGLGFSGSNTLFYLAGQRGVFHNVKDDKQKFFYLNEKQEFTAMALGTKNLMVLATKGTKPKLVMFNLKTEEKWIFPNPEYMNSSEYICVSFSFNNEFVGAQIGFPDWSFVMWRRSTRQLETCFRPFRLELGTRLYKFSFHPEDYTYVTVVGKYFLRLYQYRDQLRIHEHAFHELERSQKIFHSVTWIGTSGLFAVGTSEGIILVFQRRRLLQEVSLTSMLDNNPRFSARVNSNDKNVTCLLTTKTGIICSYGGNSALCLHRTVDGKDFMIVTSIHLSKEHQKSPEELSIVHLALSPSESTLVATTDDGQILLHKFLTKDLLGDLGYEVNFDVLLSRQHRTRVTWSDVAVSRSIQATCSSSTVIIWNFMKRKQVFSEKLDSAVCCLSLHPLGISILIAVLEEVRLYIIMDDRLLEVKKFKSSSESRVCFSSGGHMIAIANHSVIEVYCTLSYKKLASLKGHKGMIKCLVWKDNDNRLLSSDENGKICEWDTVSKKEIWSYSIAATSSSTFALLHESFYISSSDCKIRLFRNNKLAEVTDTQVEVVAMATTKQMLLAGTKHGSVARYPLALTEGPSYEVFCHHGDVIKLNLTNGGCLLLATGMDGIISLWKIQNTEDERVYFKEEEVLIEREIHEDNIQIGLALKKEIRMKTIESEKKKAIQADQFKQTEAERDKKSQEIQNELRLKILALTEEKHTIQADTERKHLEEFEALCKEREENYDDFQSKLSTEEEHYKQLMAERVTSTESYEWQIYNLKDEIKISYDNAREANKKNEIRLEELKSILRKELNSRQEMVSKYQDFYKELEERACRRNWERNSEFASDLQLIRNENFFMNSEVERISAELWYERECSRVLDSEFCGKKKVYDGLKGITKSIKQRMDQISDEICRKESVLEDKGAMIKSLEQDAKEMKHKSSEADLKLQECRNTLSEKSQELTVEKQELNKLKNIQEELLKQLAAEKHEKKTLNERLKSTEKSIEENTQKLLAAQLVLERYRTEFVDSIQGIQYKSALRWALLRIFEKRVLRASIKEEEVYVGDMDPYAKFCRQRDHYESLINTVLFRKQEVQDIFRKKYVKLAKENSDWTAFADALRIDLEQKRERISCLEKALEMPFAEFAMDPTETQRRLQDIFEKFETLEKEENEEIKNRMDLIEIQEKELQRLHGLLVVEESGKIIRKM